MLPMKYAKPLRDILILILVGVFSFFVIASWLPNTGFILDSLASVEESSNTVMKFSAATLSTSLAISALPNDFATPLAGSLADMNKYFIAILVVLQLEKLLLLWGVKLAFEGVIPAACVVGIAAVVSQKDGLRSFAARLAVLALAAALVVPCSTWFSGYVAADLTDYVERTIADTEGGADKLNEAMEDKDGEKTIFEKLSDLFQTAIRDMSNLMTHFQNTIRRCMNAIAIMILTNCVMPLANFFILRWVLAETFHVTLPIPEVRRKGRSDPDAEASSGSDASALVTAGE